MAVGANACMVYFSGSVSILVNGRPMEEVNLQKGLRHCVPLAP